jgi:hypothetical protein
MSIETGRTRTGVSPMPSGRLRRATSAWRAGWLRHRLPAPGLEHQAWPCLVEIFHLPWSASQTQTWRLGLQVGRRLRA